MNTDLPLLVGLADLHERGANEVVIIYRTPPVLFDEIQVHAHRTPCVGRPGRVSMTQELEDLLAGIVPRFEAPAGLVFLDIRLVDLRVGVVGVWPEHATELVYKNLDGSPWE